METRVARKKTESVILWPEEAFRINNSFFKFMLNPGNSVRDPCHVPHKFGTPTVQNTLPLIIYAEVTNTQKQTTQQRRLGKGG
uniref:Uncharacterized protein n=1 Tax=Globodera rostochiensis TaxID=31243 RepID=A0A914HDF3_GLORO